MDGEDEVEGEASPPQRCPDGCPNAAAPYCPLHEDPAIYKRDEGKLHLAEAYANNAAREMVFRGADRVRERRGLKELRVPTRVLDEWIVFTKQVVLDSGEFTAQGEVERRIAAWLDKMREQDWARLDRIKERYMRFTPDWRGESPSPKGEGISRPAAGPERERKVEPPKRATRARVPPPTAEADYYDNEY